MNGRFHIRCWIRSGGLVGFLLTGMLFGVRAESELEKRKAAFEAKLTELGAPKEKLKQQYVQHLLRQQELSKATGDLKALLALENELKAPGEASGIGVIAALKEAQDLFLENQQLLAEQAEAKRLQLLKQYESSLTKLQIELTKADRIPEAKEILREVERIQVELRDSVAVATDTPDDSLPNPEPVEANTGESTTEKIDLNSASLENLKTLPGIGDVMAQRIIDGRPYDSIEGILEVDGVGAGTFKKLEGLIRVK